MFLVTFKGRGKEFELELSTEDVFDESIEEIMTEFNADFDDIEYDISDFKIVDREDVPAVLIVNGELDRDVFEYILDSDDCGMCKEVFATGYHLGIDTHSICEAYMGYYGSDEDFAADYVEGTGMLHDVPEPLKSYFDMAAFASDLMYDYMEEDGHYFSNYW